MTKFITPFSSVSVICEITGEAVAQVASQTLTNLSIIDDASDMLVLRPLIAMDKQDIMNIAVNIGTEAFAQNSPEYCAVISKKPTTRARKDRIEREESKFDFALLDEAIATRRVVSDNDIIADGPTREDVNVCDQRKQGDTIIDILLIFY